MNFLFTCGGTAGHINPAIAVAGRIRELMPDSGLLFVGAEGMMESKRVPEAGFELQTVRITNLQRSLKPDKILHNLRTLRNIVTSTSEAKRIIREFQPDAAIGTGGYVCYPVLSACRSLGIPTVLHESNASPGLTTRLLANRVDRLLVGYEDSIANFSRKREVIFTGTPVRQEFADSAEPLSSSGSAGSGAGSASAKYELGLDPEVPLVVSVWGSLGSEHMNEVMIGFIRHAMNDRRFNLIHATGERGFDEMMRRVAADKPRSRARSVDMRPDEDSSSENRSVFKVRGIDVRDYIHDMSRVMAAADLVLCRAGASTLSELAIAAKPAILIPSPNVTNNHQEKNARVIESAGAAKVLTEGSFDSDSLYDLVTGMLTGSGVLEEMSRNMRALAKPDAADNIVDLVLELILNKG